MIVRGADEANATGTLAAAACTNSRAPSISGTWPRSYAAATTRDDALRCGLFVHAGALD